MAFFNSVIIVKLFFGTNEIKQTDIGCLTVYFTAVKVRHPCFAQKLCPSDRRLYTDISHTAIDLSVFKRNGRRINTVFRHGKIFGKFLIDCRSTEFSAKSFSVSDHGRKTKI